jgi:hypothetical protein
MTMNKRASFIITILSVLVIASCGTTYKAKPLPFKAPDSYGNAQKISGAVIAARAFDNPSEVKKVFGFAALDAGLLPVQIIFDNRGPNTLEIDTQQTLVEDHDGNLWPILAKNIAYERATKYAQTRETFKEGAYGGFLGAVGGALVGAAVGIVSGENVAEQAGKGAAAGAAGGAVLGGTGGYTANSASRAIMDDLREKALKTSLIEPGTLSYGIIFFPGEAKSAKRLRLKVVETDTGKSSVTFLDF